MTFKRSLSGKQHFWGFWVINKASEFKWSKNKNLHTCYGHVTCLCSSPACFSSLYYNEVYVVCTLNPWIHSEDTPISVFYTDITYPLITTDVLQGHDFIDICLEISFRPNGIILEALFLRTTNHLEKTDNVLVQLKWIKHGIPFINWCGVDDDDDDVVEQAKYCCLMIASCYIHTEGHSEFLL